MNDLDQAEQNEDLNDEGNQGEQRVIMVFLVQLGLLLADGLGIAEVLDLDAVDLRHDLHHDDAVPLTPQGKRHENDLHDDGEQQNGHPPVTRQIVARLHDQPKHLRERFQHS